MPDLQPAAAAQRRRRFSRRALLIGGGGVAALAALGAGKVLLPGPLAAGRRHLSANESACALALADTLFARGEPGMPLPAQTDVLGRLDEAVGYMHPDIRKLFKLGLRAFEYATLPGLFSRFSALGADERAAVVRGWESSKTYAKQAILLSLRFQVGIAYFESDAARAACGWSLGCTPSSSEG